jgi:hypothetical protein
MNKLDKFLSASQTHDIAMFLDLAFPPDWSGISARILETGVTMSADPCKWAPRLTMIPPTKRYGIATAETAMKSIIFRVHDCIHQLWGLPNPGTLSSDDFYYYKRAQMCGEVAVLTLTEFVYCQWIHDTFPELSQFIVNRNAIPMRAKHMKNKSVQQMAMRLDDLLHKKSRPLWVRNDPVAKAWVDDYVPMLEEDRDFINKNWGSMVDDPSCLDSLAQAPKARFSKDLDGLELTLWMINDFEHLMTTTPDIDLTLMAFNRIRRAKINLPTKWAT